MAFTDHIEDLRWHIVRSLAVVIVAAIAVFIKIEWIFEHIILGPVHPYFISYKWFCELGHLLHIDALCLKDVKIKFQNTELAGQFVMSLSVSMALGFIMAFPYVLWEFWRFIKPALKPREVKYARGMVFWCSLLFFSGVLFSYYIIAPYTINFFGSYQLSPEFQNIITMDNYYDTMSDLILGMGIVFELPMIVYFLSRIGILTPMLMRSKRRYAILILLILAEVITPPDWFSCFLVFIPLYILYELSVIISARAYNERKRKQALKDADAND
ncbi:MAG: twin-arginine translocase subunit TatC [Taibaiella sp.]|nr:twin-arginine translocase subunit TatC [Taibaiella sp.]